MLWVKPVDDDFNARFAATGRAYRYVILNRVARSGLHRGRVTWTRRHLDADRMQEAADSLLGEHDFSSYRALACQAKSPIKNLRRFDVERRGDFIIIDVEANAFLHHMVRNLVGVLMTIGRSEQEISWARQVLDYKDRKKGGVTAPPDGLYFVRVDYPEKFQIASPLMPEYWG
jgi:tRNA pseudouridine38-40 synthase